MLDFIFRRGNPTNSWARRDPLELCVELNPPSLNGVRVGASSEDLSFLGRNDRESFGTYCYSDLGIGIDIGKGGEVAGFTVVLDDEEGLFQPFPGSLTWNRQSLEIQALTIRNLPDVFGQWYWLDTDDDESIAFYEFPHHEMQIELAPSGEIKRITITKTALLADPQQREAYGVDKPWPPEDAHG